MRQKNLNALSWSVCRIKDFTFFEGMTQEYGLTIFDPQREFEEGNRQPFR